MAGPVLTPQQAAALTSHRPFWHRHQTRMVELMTGRLITFQQVETLSRRLAASREKAPWAISIYYHAEDDLVSDYFLEDYFAHCGFICLAYRNGGIDVKYQVEQEDIYPSEQTFRLPRR